MKDLLDFIQAQNFSFQPELNGKVHRFNRNSKSKTGWHVGWQLFGLKSGKPYEICIFGDWKTSEKHEYKGAPGEKLSPDDRKIINDKLAEAARLNEEERLKGQDEARQRAAKVWARSKPVYQSSYFSRKKISALFGAQTNLDEESGARIILVPMRDVDGELWGIQRIFEDGQKRFLSGQRILGLFHVIGEISNDTKLAYVAEGFATGASVHEATGLPVVVVFNTANMEAAALAVRRRYKDLAIIVAGDDDVKVDGNPGRTKAEKVAKLLCGTAVFPPEPTDWNDYLVKYGLEKTREAISSKDSEEIGYVPLGFDGPMHYFYAARSRDVKSFASFTTVNLLQIMPLEYWGSLYATKKGGVDWVQAISDLADQSNKAGPYDSFKVRGIGVWRENGKIVVNTGHEKIPSKKYVYISTINKTRPVHPEPMTVKETAILRNACEMLKWRDEKSGIFLSGWLAIGRLGGILPVRPHLWFTGASQTGKSTVMTRIVYPALGKCLFAQGGSTEAGVRQTVKCDALPLMIDEFETTDETSKAKIAAIIELLRQTWSYTDGHVVKGSSGGTASAYALNFPAIVSSIRTSLTNDADRSRFTILELAPHQDDKSHWKILDELLKKIDTDYGDRLFARQLTKVDTIIASYKIIADALSGAVSRRFGQQVGMILAGWYSLVSDDVITKEAASSLADDLGLKEEKEAAAITDEKECFQKILDYNIQLYGEIGVGFDGGPRRATVRKSIGRILSDKDEGEIEQLRDIGIAIDENYIFISSGHDYLRNHVFRNSRWQNCWGETLTRLPGAKGRINKRFLHGRMFDPCKATRIPISHVTSSVTPV